MKKVIYTLLLFPLLAVAQDKIITTKSQAIENEKDKVAAEITTIRTDSSGVKRFVNWEKFNKIGLDFNQAAFVNWNSGGSNSVSGLLAINLNRNYTRDHVNWKNEFIFRYGINSQQGRETRKTDDIIQLNSNFGYRSSDVSNWFYSSKFSFTTQATNGYSYPDTTTPISTFFAPAYMFLGVGAEYALKEKQFSVYISPLTQKTTLVLDQDLANAGAYGVIKGKKSRTEVGFFVSSLWKNEILKNVVLENRVSLYSDYLNKFGNIDVDWQLKLDFTVNQYVRANIFGHLIYDDDIKTKQDIDGVQVSAGPKVQLKQILGIGVVYEFK